MNPLHVIPVPKPNETVIDRIARVCHEVNRAYCKALGDDSQKPWDEAPEWQRKSARNGVIMHMTRRDADEETSHDEWMREKLATGWKWGPVKDEVAKTHPCIVDFSKLPPEQKAKDYLFRAVVLHTAVALGIQLGVL